MAEFEKLNAHVLGISVDSVFSHRAFAEELGGLDFPLLADFHPKGEVTTAYGLWNDKWGASKRAIIVIDEQGVVRHSEIVAKGLPSVPEILQNLEGMDA